MSDTLDKTHFTLVFEGDLSSFKTNPLKTVTPFGTPVAAAFGNAFAEIDTLNEKLEDAADEARESYRDGQRDADMRRDD